MTPPPFRLELASEVTDSKDIDPATCWTVRLQNGSAQYRVDGEHLVYVYDPVSQRATERGFRSAKVASLEPGDKLFVMTPELRDMVEDALAAAGIPHQSDKTYEASLRDYHERVLKALGSRFHAPSLTAQMRALRAAMEQANPEAAKNLPREETIRHWIDLGASAKTEFEKLRPQAPGKEANFKLFAEALGFSNLEAAIFWHSVIQPVRNTRRQDSRHLGDFYSYLLLQPESAIVSANLTRQTVQSLFDKARESVVVVLAVDPPKKAAQ